MTKYYTVMLSHTGEIVKTNAAVEAAIAPIVSDWMRFNGFQYLVASEKEAHDIFKAVHPVLPAGANLLVMAVLINDRWGFVSDLVGSWIRKHSP
jgi:hypothetical protein